MDFERSRRHVAEQELSLEQTKRQIAMNEAHHNALKVIELEVDLARAESKARSLNHEIAQANRTIEAQKLTLSQYVQKSKEQQEILADWIVSQKAFKDLAIQFGSQIGVDTEEVKEMGMKKKLDVLENKNKPTHGTNADGSSLVVNLAEKLKEKFHKEKAERQAKKAGA